MPDERDPKDKIGTEQDEPRIEEGCADDSDGTADDEDDRDASHDDDAGDDA